MIIFGSILTTSESSSIFGGNWGSIENWLEPKTKPPSKKLVCPNLWNALYVYHNSNNNNDISEIAVKMLRDNHLFMHWVSRRYILNLKARLLKRMFMYWNFLHMFSVNAVFHYWLWSIFSLWKHKNRIAFRNCPSVKFLCLYTTTQIWIT